MLLSAYKNNTSSTVELQFNDYVERVRGFSVGKYHLPEVWNGSFAQSQAIEFTKRSSGRIVTEEGKKVPLDSIHQSELDRFHELMNKEAEQTAVPTTKQNKKGE